MMYVTILRIVQSFHLPQLLYLAQNVDRNSGMYFYVYLYKLSILGFSVIKLKILSRLLLGVVIYF
jgi:hypothetical protein